LPRTGSTLLSEALSRVPHAFIFNEPHLGKNYFAVQEHDASILRPEGVDLFAFRRKHLAIGFILRRFRWLGISQDYFLSVFRRELVPTLLIAVKQLGVKEIKHTGWENYLKHFPEMVVVFLGRDPRDIYLSYYRLWRTGVVSWREPFNPATLAEFFLREFSLQLALMDACPTIIVKYEDFCTRPACLEEIKAFTKSEIPVSGSIGSFVSQHPARKFEQETHRGVISGKSVFRWKKERDAALLDQSHQFFEKVSDYARFWGYTTD